MGGRQIDEIHAGNEKDEQRRHGKSIHVHRVPHDGGIILEGRREVDFLQRLNTGGDVRLAVHMATEQAFHLRGSRQVYAACGWS